MDPPRDSPPFKAPGRTSSSSRQEARPSPGFGRAFEAPAAKRQDLPPIYERLARPETQEEYFHGQLRRKVPANPPHATQHFRLAYVLNAHVAEGYQGAVEMLTRTGRDTDFAPDASIFPLAPEDGTGERRSTTSGTTDASDTRHPSRSSARSRSISRASFWFSASAASARLSAARRA